MLALIVVWKPVIECLAALVAIIGAIFATLKFAERWRSGVSGADRRRLVGQIDVPMQTNGGRIAVAAGVGLAAFGIHESLRHGPTTTLPGNGQTPDVSDMMAGVPDGSTALADLPQHLASGADGASGLLGVVREVFL